MSSPFMWKGKPLHTMSELTDAMIAIQTSDEAEAFVRDYRKIVPPR